MTRKPSKVAHISKWHQIGSTKNSLFLLFFRNGVTIVLLPFILSIILAADVQCSAVATVESRAKNCPKFSENNTKISKIIHFQVLDF
jgi:hypothetical protein